MPIQHQSIDYDQEAETSEDLDSFLSSLGIGYLWNQLRGHGHTNVLDLAQKLSLEELK